MVEHDFHIHQHLALRALDMVHLAHHKIAGPQHTLCPPLEVFDDLNMTSLVIRDVAVAVKAFPLYHGERWAVDFLV